MQKYIQLSMFIVFFCCRINSAFAQQDDLNVLGRWVEWSDGNNMLVHHLNKQAFTYLDVREKEIEKLNTRADWIKRQGKVKDLLMELVGPFPEKTPLNPQVTGVVRKDGFRIEKIIYESIPGLYVTAVMLIPDGIIKNKPAIIHVSGHGFPAFRSENNQRYLYNLARKGFVVFAIDPLGQGERLQYWDDEKKISVLGSPVSEHSYFGNQIFLTGTSPIKYFVWDGIRGVDYLLTREEVDPDRIGIFGCSGGGTQTTFIAAFDERIKAAVPGCYITGFRRLLECCGAQDAEQNIYHGLMHGLTHADFLQVRAPRPLLISSTTRDVFSIQGAIETYQEVKLAYTAFGREENAGQTIDDAGHGFFNTITDVYAFFQKVLENPGSSAEENFEGFEQNDLQITPTGQLSNSIGGILAFEVNKRESEKLIQKIKDSRINNNEHLKIVTAKAKELSGYIQPGEEVKSVFRGRYQRDGYSVEMIALHGEGEYFIPLLLFVPESGTNFPSIIYLHPEGKITDAHPAGRIEQLVKKGYMVAAPDIIGIGETEDKSNSYKFSAQYISTMIGRSVIGIQSGDVNRVVNFIKSRSDADKNTISAVAFETMCPVLLHSAAFNNSINSVTLIGSLISYRSIVMNKFYNDDFLKYWVAGSLKAYDLPDLMGCIAPRKIGLVDLKNQMKEPASKNLINEELEFPFAVYTKKNAAENINIFPANQDLVSIVNWNLKY